MTQARRACWALSGVLAVALFGSGLLFGDPLGSSNHRTVTAARVRITAYFLHNGSDVRALAFFHLLSALALLCFVATCMPMNNSSITYAVRLLGAIMGFGWIVVISVLLAARASRVTSGYQRCG